MNEGVKDTVESLSGWRLGCGKLDIGIVVEVQGREGAAPAADVATGEAGRGDTEIVEGRGAALELDAEPCRGLHTEHEGDDAGREEMDRSDMFEMMYAVGDTVGKGLDTGDACESDS